ncbi:MAG: hypothetical protein HC802_00530 [Caldilineaceae bacterium]|nr:hypothetical protein [Caldilineaceae bacterium]
MATYRYNTVVEKDGSVHLSGLPPEKEIEIVILDRSDDIEEMKNWLADIRGRHPLAAMDKDEILNLLRDTRESVWAERHES